MLHTAGLLGQVVAKLGRQPRIPQRAPGPFNWQKVPIANYKRRGPKDHSPHDITSPLNVYITTLPPEPPLWPDPRHAIHFVPPIPDFPPECCCFRHCDKLYQGFLPAERKLWKNGVKAPGMSSYDLWMSESLTCALSERNLPDSPSISGGFSTSKVVPGSRPYPAHCYPTPFHDEPMVLSDLWFQYAWGELYGGWMYEVTTKIVNSPFIYPVPYLAEPYVLFKYWPQPHPPSVVYHGALALNHPWTIFVAEQRPWTPPPPFIWPALP